MPSSPLLFVSLFVSLVFLLPQISQAQYSGTLEELFFDRQPSARSEAMGRAFAPTGTEPSVSFFNPSAIAQSPGLQFNTTYTNLPQDQYYHYLGTTYKVNRFATFGLSRFHFHAGTMEYLGEDDMLHPFDAFSTAYTFTYALQPIKNWYLGSNLNYYQQHHQPENTLSTLSADMGILKLIPLGSKESLEQQLTLAASFSNITGSKLNGADLPVFYRLGFAYKAVKQKHNRNFLDFTFQGAYKNLLNSADYTSLHFGGELAVWEVIAIRAGYYSDKRPDNDGLSTNMFTYGIGIQLPMNTFSNDNIPLLIQLDFTRLPIEKIRSITPAEQPMFTTFNLGVHWVINDKKR